MSWAPGESEGVHVVAEREEIEGTIHLRELIQDAQEFGSDDEFMVSRVFFDLEVDTRMFRGLHADLKQVVGSKFEDEAIQVTGPHGYPGPHPVNQKSFQDAVRRYFLRFIGPNAQAFNLGKSKGVRMMNNSVSAHVSEPIEIDRLNPTGGGW